MDVVTSVGRIVLYSPALHVATQSRNRLTETVR